MNHYTLADMKPGLTESFTVTVTQQMMDQFLAITGDCSPIHVDADYAKDRGYPGCVVYGMLGGQFLLHAGRGLSAGGALPAARCGMQIRQTHFCGGYTDHHRHGC